MRWMLLCSFILIQVHSLTHLLTTILRACVHAVLALVVLSIHELHKLLLGCGESMGNLLSICSSPCTKKVDRPSYLLLGLKITLTVGLLPL